MILKKKHSVCLLISAILGLAYAIYLFVYFGGALFSSADSVELLGSSIAGYIVAPHMACVIIAVIFNILGFIANNHGFALTGAIAYTVAIPVLLLYTPFVILQSILSFVGFANLKTINQLNENIQTSTAKRNRTSDDYYYTAQPFALPFWLMIVLPVLLYAALIGFTYFNMLFGAIFCIACLIILLILVFVCPISD